MISVKVRVGVEVGQGIVLGSPWSHRCGNLGGREVRVDPKMGQIETNPEFFQNQF